MKLKTEPSLIFLNEKIIHFEFFSLCKDYNTLQISCVDSLSRLKFVSCEMPNESV